MNKDVLNAIRQIPEVQAAVSEAVQGLLQDPDVTLQSVETIIRVLEFVLQNPDSYGDFVQTAVQSEIIDPEDLPEQFDPTPLTVILLALKVVQQQMSENGPGFAQGGLNRIARMGRNGDSELAHINPFERRLLESYGGSGTINPQTGLREFGWFKKTFKKVFKKIAAFLPVILSIVAPGIGTAIGAALGASGTAASMLGGAAIGGLSSAASGGNLLKGALGGALGAGAGSALGGTVNSALGTSLSQGTQNVIGSSLIGGAQSALSGKGFAQGAAAGALGGYAGGALSNAASGVGGALGSGLQTAGTQFGNALTMGATPKQAAITGGLSGLAAGMSYQNPTYSLSSGSGENMGLKQTPSDMAVEGLKADSFNSEAMPEMGLSTNYNLSGPDTTSFKGDTFAADYSLVPQSNAMGAASAQPELGTGLQVSPLNTIAAQAPAAPASSSGTANKGFSLGNAAAMLPLLSLFNSAETPEQIQQVTAGMTPEQQEYFNRPMRTWNWDTIGAAAKMQGLPVGSYVARNWDKMSGGMYDNPEEQTPAMPAMARGGALSRVAYMVAGGGTGRSDSIDAKLSDSEYVMDAETVALLGDGSAGAGARRLDEMRAKIRQHKGKSMARGKFSANAKSPLSYIKEAR